VIDATIGAAAPNQAIASLRLVPILRGSILTKTVECQKIALKVGRGDRKSLLANKFRVDGPRK
jgi:hypothetical protein